MNIWHGTQCDQRVKQPYQGPVSYRIRNRPCHDTAWHGPETPPAPKIRDGHGGILRSDSGILEIRNPGMAGMAECPPPLAWEWRQAWRNISEWFRRGCALPPATVPPTRADMYVAVCSWGIWLHHFNACHKHYSVTLTFILSIVATTGYIWLQSSYTHVDSPPLQPATSYMQRPTCM
jgi:hypothetical protein